MKNTVSAILVGFTVVGMHLDAWAGKNWHAAQEGEKPAPDERPVVRIEGEVIRAPATVIKNSVGATTTIAWLAPQGKEVEEGDLLVRLDESPLHAKQRQYQLNVEASQERVSKAEEVLTMVKEEITNRRAAGEMAVRAAELEQSVSKVEFEVERQQALSELFLAREELKTEELRWEVLHKADQEPKQNPKQTPSSLALAEARLAMVKRREALKLAEAKLRLFDDHALEHQRAMLKLAFHEQNAERYRLLRQMQTEQKKAEADLSARQSQVQSYRARLEKIKVQIANCQVRSPHDGVVELEGPIMEGAAVRDRQTILRLESRDLIHVRVPLSSAQLRQLQSVKEIKVRLAGRAKTVFPGKVVAISSRSGKIEARISLSGMLPRLMPGAKATVELLVK